MGAGGIRTKFTQVNCINVYTFGIVAILCHSTSVVIGSFGGNGRHVDRFALRGLNGRFLFNIVC